jgi:hypothetical protein
MPRKHTINRTRAGRRGRPTKLLTLSTTELMQELERRQSALHDPIRQRDELNAEVELLGGAFGRNAAISVKTIDVRRGPGRPKGSAGGPCPIVSSRPRCVRLIPNERTHPNRKARPSTSFRSVATAPLRARSIPKACRCG